MKTGLFSYTVGALALSLIAMPCASQTLSVTETPADATSAESAMGQLQNAFVRVASIIKPSVVTIYTEKLPASFPASDPSGKSTKPTPRSAPSLPEDSQASLGSGMILDNQGHILTNYHVIKDAAVVRVLRDPNTDPTSRPIAKVIGFDEESDLAVLQVTPSPSMVPVEFGDSDAVRIGEWVLAVGAPFDQAQTVTAGVISAKARHLTKDGQLSLQDYLQTDASINPGNSGGPLVDMQGKVIGVNTAILSPSRYSVGIGFAVPSATIRRLLPTLLEGKHVERGFIGIRYLPLDPEVAEAFGISSGMQIGSLAQKDGKPYGPAYDAGLRDGDIITAINGQTVTSSESFRKFVSSLQPGTVIQLDIIRPLQQGVQRRTFEITLGDRTEPDDARPTKSSAISLNLPGLGLQIENSSELTAAQRTLLGQAPSGLGNEDNTVIVTYVRPGSSGDSAQIHQGEIIKKINIMHRSVTGVEDLNQWQTISNKAQILDAVKDLPPHTRILMQLQDRQQTVSYKLVTTLNTPIS